MEQYARYYADMDHMYNQKKEKGMPTGVYGSMWSLVGLKISVHTVPTFVYL